MINKLGWIKKLNLLLAGTVLSAGLYFGYEQTKKNNVESYIDKNLDRIMKTTEKAVNISFDKKPVIEFAYIFDGNEMLAGTSNDTIVLYYNKPLTTPEMNNVDKFVHFFNSSDNNSVDFILFHELGHVYQNQLKNKLHLEKTITEQSTQEEIMCSKILSEGIATYFQLKTLNIFLEADSENIIPSLGKIPNPEIMPLEMDAIQRNALIEYLQGFYIVKPIIDKQGIKGIENVLRNPIKESEYHDLKLYQKRILTLKN